MKDGKPHCLKTKLNNKSENKDYNFYKKVPQEPDAEELVDLPSAIVLNGKLHNNILKLFWLPPSQGIKTFKYYVIVIIKEDKSSQDTETTWKDPKFIFPENNDCKLCEYEFNNLEYNTKYKYLILAVNSDGVGETSNIIKIEPNNPIESSEVPKEIPPHIKNINCKADGTYSLDTPNLGQFWGGELHFVAHFVGIGPFGGQLCQTAHDCVCFAVCACVCAPGTCCATQIQTQR